MMTHNQRQQQPRSNVHDAKSARLMLHISAGVGSIWQTIQKQREKLLKAAPGNLDKDLRQAPAAPSTMRKVRNQLKKAAGRLQETAPQLTIAGGGLFMTLNNWGLVPESDVLPLEQFNRVWQPDEPDRCSLIPCTSSHNPNCLCTHLVS